MDKNLQKTRLDHIPVTVCDCGCKLYNMVYELRELSAFVSPTGQKEFIGSPAFVCRDCGKRAELKP